jgi:putative ATP-dependent endonuclease of OLD family
MKLQAIRLSNFQCFGPEPTEPSLEALTFLIGPNGSGKTAAMQALCRLFAFDPTLRRIKKSDFHVPHDEVDVPDRITVEPVAECCWNGWPNRVDCAIAW